VASGSAGLSATSRVLLGVVVVGSVLAVGSMHVPVLMVVAGLAAIGSACAAISGTLPRNVPGPAWLLLGLALFTLLQAVPLPMSLLQRLAPSNAEVWSRALLPLGEGPPAFASLSLDPGASLVEMLKLSTYLAVFLSATAAGAGRGASWGGLLIGASAFILALASMGHAVLDASRVFGIYEPRLGGQGLRVAPLIDVNNLAGYLNFGGLCLFSLAAMARPPIPRWLLVLGIAPIASMSLLTGSRGGLLSLLAGIVLLLGLMYRTSQRGLAIPVSWKALASAGAVSLALAVGFALIASGARIRHLLLDDNLSKLTVAAQSVPMMRDHLWWGIGRGAFESVFPAYHAGADNAIYSHPENFAVQWLTEWGLPCTLLLVGTGSWLLRPSAWGIRSSLPACGLFCGAAAVLIQNLVDLSFEVPGVAIALWAAAGLAWGHNSADTPRLGSKRALVAVSLLLGLAAVLVAVGAKGLNTLTTDRDLALTSMPARARDESEWRRFRPLIREIVGRHPAEPYFYRLGAIAAWRVGSKDPMPWLQRALERGLNAGRTHYLLGSYLAALGRRSQALLELRWAVTLDPQLSTRAAKVAVHLTHDREQLLRAVPDEGEAVTMLNALARELRDINCPDALELVREGVRRSPRSAVARLSLVRSLLAAAKSKEACEPLTRAALISEAEGELASAARLDATAADLPLLRSKVLLASSRPAEAVALLRKGCPGSERRSECLSLWIDAAVQARDSAALDEVGRLASAEACEAAGCAKIQWTLGEAARAIGNSHAALGYFERSAAAEQSARRWRQLGRAAVELGEHARGLRAFENAMALAPGDVSIRTEAEKARRQALLKGALTP
jgi:tetratricopeptide (TPR) repeat protein